MKAITAYVNCGGQHPKVLARASISTVADFRQLLKEVLIELYEIRRDAPDCPLFLFVNYVKLDDSYSAELLAAASENGAFNGGKRRGKFASFARKERPNLPAIFAMLLFL